MAIYHFSVKVISRAAGSSVATSAAYRSGSRRRDERLGDRSALWNEVEATELRKDAQPSREVEFAIPRELNRQQGIDPARDFVRLEFVERGMIANMNVHWDMGADGLAKPHAQPQDRLGHRVHQRAFTRA